MFNWWKKNRNGHQNDDSLEKSYDFGRNIGSQITAKVDEFKENRIDEVSVNLLSAFKDRLETVFDSPPHDPKLVAQIELNEFRDQIKRFSDKMWAESKDFLNNELGILDEIGDDETTEKYIDYLELQISTGVNLLIHGAKMLYDKKLEEIDQSST